MTPRKKRALGGLSYILVVLLASSAGIALDLWPLWVSIPMICGALCLSVVNFVVYWVPYIQSTRWKGERDV